MGFLADCGLCLDDLDPKHTKQNLLDIKSIRVRYPENPAMLAGLKALAIAETDFRSLVNQDVLLRCDYRALTQGETDVSAILQDT